MLSEPEKKIRPKKKTRPTSPRQIAERVMILEEKLQRLHNTVQDGGLILGCGCKIEIHSFNGIVIKYCEQHNTFLFSPYHEEGDVIYCVSEEEVRR